MNKMKKWVGFLTLLVFAALPVAAEGAQEKGDDGKLVIGCTFDYVGDFMAYVSDGAAAYGEEYPDVEVIILDAKMDLQIQNSQVENLIARRVDAIVIKPVDTSATQPISNLCKEAGIPLVATNSEVSSQHTSYIGSDHKLSGLLQMEAIADLLGGKGNVAILVGDPKNQASRDRTGGNKEIVDQFPGMEVVVEQTGKWMRDEGMRVMENWLQSGIEIDAVVGNNDEMAIGAALAIAESGRDILVGGIDATPEALGYLKDGTLACTVFQNGYAQGYVAVETAVAAVKGETVESYVDVPYELVTKDKADEYLAKYK